MDDKATAGLRSKPVVLVGGVLFVVVYVGLFALTARGFADHDCFVMGEVAARVLQGKLLYAEAWDNKAPLALLFYALPQLFFPRSYVAFQVFLSLWLLVQAAILFLGLRGVALVKRFTACGLVLLLPLTHEEFSWASSEHLVNLFVLIVLLVAFRTALLGRLCAWEFLIAGLALALAFNSRQTSVLFGAVPAVALLFANCDLTQKARAAGAFVAGVLIGFAAVIALVMAVGDFNGYVYAVFIAPSKYAGSPRDLARLVWRFRNDVVLFLFIGSGLLALFGRHRLLAFTIMAVALAVVMAPFRSYTHYWAQLFPALAFLAMLAMPDAGQPLPDTTAAPRTQALSLVLVVFAFLLGNAILTVSFLNVQQPTVAEYDRVVVAIKETAIEGDTLFAYGDWDAYIPFASGVEPVHKYFWSLWLMKDWSGVLPEGIDAVLKEYRSAPPTLLVLHEKKLEELQTNAKPPLIRADVHDLLLYYYRDVGYHQVASSGDWIILRKGK